VIPIWPATLPQGISRNGASFGPMPGRAVFQPERGPNIERRATTAETMAWAAVVPQLRTAQVEIFRAWFDVRLGGGVSPFAMRDPVTSEAWRWKIVGGEREYDVTPRGANLYDLSFQLHRLPGPPWWQPYVSATGDLRLPFVVADYANAVFGVDLVRTPAASVAAVTGTFDVHTTATPSGVVTVQPAEVVSAGEIPASAPVGVSRIVAYPL
jgi:hypothetical protein